MTAPLVVAKVGGSLFDLPDLRQRLLGYRDSVQPARLLFFPGGGATADLVRAWDRTHDLGEEASHWLAVCAMSLNARLLETLLKNVSGPNGTGSEKGPDTFLDPLAWLSADEAHPDHCPHHWDVTSDSLALRVAQKLGAARLDLLKSAPLPDGTSWAAAAELKLIDAYFTTQLERGPLPVRWVNLRAASVAGEPS